MCGRYYRRLGKQRIGDAFNISDLPSSLVIADDYNMAPTTSSRSSEMTRKPATESWS